jgi:hypothetical protein
MTPLEPRLYSSGPISAVEKGRFFLIASGAAPLFPKATRVGAELDTCKLYCPIVNKYVIDASEA